MVYGMKMGTGGIRKKREFRNLEIWKLKSLVLGMVKYKVSMRHLLLFLLFLRG